MSASEHLTDIPWLPRAVGEHLPWLSVAQMREIDRAMVEDYGIVLLQMMEHAGRHLSHLARARFLGGDARGKRVTVLAGTGGNGGGALVCARRLAGWGAEVTVGLSAHERFFGGVPGHQLAIVRRLGIPLLRAATLPERAPDLVVDGIIGYSLSGAPSEAISELISWANEASDRILSLDVPSGLDATTGAPSDPTIRAAATLTLALPKSGLRAPSARGLVGELYLADLGVPPQLYGPALSLAAAQPFAHADVVRVL